MTKKQYLITLGALFVLLLLTISLIPMTRAADIIGTETSFGVTEYSRFYANATYDRAGAPIHVNSIVLRNVVITFYIEFNGAGLTKGYLCYRNISDCNVTSKRLLFTIDATQTITQAYLYLLNDSYFFLQWSSNSAFIGGTHYIRLRLGRVNPTTKTVTLGTVFTKVTGTVNVQYYTWDKAWCKLDNTHICGFYRKYTITSGLYEFHCTRLTCSWPVITSSWDNADLNRRIEDCKIDYLSVNHTAVALENGTTPFETHTVFYEYVNPPGIYGTMYSLIHPMGERRTFDVCRNDNWSYWFTGMLPGDDYVCTYLVKFDFDIYDAVTYGNDSLCFVNDRFDLCGYADNVSLLLYKNETDPYNFTVSCYKAVNYQIFNGNVSLTRFYTHRNWSWYPELFVINRSHLVVTENDRALKTFPSTYWYNTSITIDRIKLWDTDYIEWLTASSLTFDYTVVLFFIWLFFAYVLLKSNNGVLNALLGAFFTYFTYEMWTKYPTVFGNTIFLFAGFAIYAASLIMGLWEYRKSRSNR